MLKSLYKLKQLSREWYIEAAKGLVKLRLKPTFTDIYIFVHKDRNLIVGLYVDDIIILINDLIIVQEFKRAVTQR